MRPVVFVVPGPIDTRTGGSNYDRRMVEGLRHGGRSVDVRELDGAFPCPSAAAVEPAAAAFASIRDGAIAVIDGLVLGALSHLVEREARRLRVVALIHLPVAADVSIDPGTAAQLETGERRALAAAALVIVTGSASISLLARHDLPRDRLVVVEPGTDRAPLARGSGGTPLQLLCVATIGPGKGHEILVRALAAMPDRGWRLTCAGSVTRHPGTADQLRATVNELGLGDRITLVGELDARGVAAAYDGADLFVLATLQETYGMAVAEALARGLPVVSTTTGAIIDLVGQSAGLLVGPGRLEELTEALARMVGDAQLRARLADGARRVRDRLQTWEDAAERMNAVLNRLDTHD